MNKLLRSTKINKIITIIKIAFMVLLIICILGEIIIPIISNNKSEIYGGWKNRNDRTIIFTSNGTFYVNEQNKGTYYVDGDQLTIEYWDSDDLLDSKFYTFEVDENILFLYEGEFPEVYYRITA